MHWRSWSGVLERKVRTKLTKSTNQASYPAKESELYCSTNHSTLPSFGGVHDWRHTDTTVKYGSSFLSWWSTRIFMAFIHWYEISFRVEMLSCMPLTIMWVSYRQFRPKLYCGLLQYLSRAFQPSRCSSSSLPYFFAPRPAPSEIALDASPWQRKVVPVWQPLL